MAVRCVYRPSPVYSLVKTLSTKSVVSIRSFLKLCRVSKLDVSERGVRGNGVFFIFLSFSVKKWAAISSQSS